MCKLRFKIVNIKEMHLTSCHKWLCGSCEKQEITGSNPNTRKGIFLKKLQKIVGVKGVDPDGALVASSDLSFFSPVWLFKMIFWNSKLQFWIFKPTVVMGYHRRLKTDGDGVLMTTDSSPLTRKTRVLRLAVIPPV